MQGRRKKTTTTQNTGQSVAAAVRVTTASAHTDGNLCGRPAGLGYHFCLAFIARVDFKRGRNITSIVSLTTVKEVWIMDHINFSILVPSRLFMCVALKWHNMSCSLSASQWALRNLTSPFDYLKKMKNHVNYYYSVLWKLIPQLIPQLNSLTVFPAAHVGCSSSKSASHHINH